MAHYAERTAQKMADGAIHDQLGGGFHRYCADRAWAVPHFEKMLYDNAQLGSVYLHLWRQTGAVWARRVAERTCAWLLRDLLRPDGLFAASLSAEDSNGDGAFYRWTADELGDWAGVLGVTGPGATALRAPAVDDAAWRRERRRLYRARRHRAAPDRDDKIITEWNALAVSALTEAAVLLERPDLLSTAEHTAGELLIRQRRGPTLLRTADGVAGVLADYAALADALLLLHQATGARCWLDEAGQLIAHARVEFRGPAGEWFDSGPASAAPVRMADLADSGTAAGPAAFATTLWRHGRIAGEPEHRREAVELLETLLGAGLDPVEMGTALALAEAITAPRVEAYTPRGGPLQRLAWTDPQPGVLALTGDTPLAEGKNAEHAYVCHDRFCSAPTTDPEHFAQLLKAS